MFINDLLTTHLFHGLGNSSTRIFLKSALKSRARDLNSLRESMHKRVVQDIRTTEIEDIAHLILKVLRLFFKDHNRLCSFLRAAALIKGNCSFGKVSGTVIYVLIM